jgi:hypothetical protein
MSVAHSRSGASVADPLQAGESHQSGDPLAPTGQAQTPAQLGVDARTP